jgi:RNA polymerase sigma factor (sigma-70 family)
MRGEIELVRELIGYYRTENVGSAEFESAWMDLYDIMAKRLFAYFLGRGVPHRKLGDCVQRASILVEKYLARLKKPEGFLGYLYRVAFTVFREEILRPDPADPDRNQSFSPEESEDEEDQRLALMVAAPFDQAFLAEDCKWKVDLILQRLEIECRELLLLRFCEGLPPREIREVWEVVGTKVDVRLNRCKTRAAQVARELAAAGKLRDTPAVLWTQSKKS